MSISLSNPRKLDSLEAINLILNAYGQASVSRLNANAEAIKARTHLGRVLVQVSAGPWRFSTVEQGTLVRDNQNRIAISSDIITVVPSGIDQSKQYVMRQRTSAPIGLYLYDRENTTYAFDHDVRADITYAVAFDNLGQTAAWYVACLAAESYLAQNRPADPVLASLREATAKALIQLEQQEAREVGGTLRDHNPHFFRTRNKPRSSGA